MPCIAFIHNRFPAGGAERITMDIADYLYKSGKSYQVYVYASSFQNQDSIPHITTRTIPRKGKARSEAVESLIIQDRIDIVVQVTAPIDDISGIRARTGCKAVLANHGEPFWQRYTIINRRQNSFIKRVLWRMYNKRRYIDEGLAMKMAIERSRRQYDECDAYTVLCNAYKEHTEKAFGIDPAASHIYPIENPEHQVNDIQWDKDKIILFCGRLELWSKRIDRLLRIWGTIQDRIPDWKLMIVGDGPGRIHLERQVKYHKLKRVEFKGAHSDTSQFYRKASIVALTSQTEGWPLALTEGQAHGCIPIAFGCTEGIHDILSPNGKNGFEIHAFDENEYARTLVKITEMTQEEQLAIRQSAVAKRLQYTPEHIASKWERLFDGLMNL